MSGGAKWVKKNPEIAGLLAVAATAATAGAAAPALGAAGAATAGAGAAGATGAAAGMGGGAASLFGPSAGLGASLLADTAAATPFVTGGAAPFAAGATTSAPGVAGMFAQAPAALPKAGLLSKLNSPMTRLGINAMTQEEEPQQPIASPQQTNLPPQDIPSFAQLSGRGMPGTGTSVPQSGMGEMDEEQRKWLMMLKQMGVA
jgi:hypothetical protein